MEKARNHRAGASCAAAIGEGRMAALAAVRRQRAYHCR